MILTYYHAPDISEGSNDMRGPDDQTNGMFSYLSPEQRVRQDHPLRAIRRLTDDVFAALSPRFTAMYSKIGRPSIPPEQLLRALLIQSLYTVRSERLLMEEIDYSVLYRWFVGLGMDDPIWSPTTFSKNRDRLLESDIAAAFFDEVLAQARAAGLLSDEHFTVDGTLLEAWASLKSFRRKSQELPPQGCRADIPTGRPGEPDRELSWGIATERHASVHHGSRCPPRAQGPRARSETLVRGPFAARQSPRVGGERLHHTRHRHRGTRGGAAAAGRQRPARQHRRR